MKRIIPPLIIVLTGGFISKGFTQSIAPSILNSAGGSAIAGAYTIEYSLGEMMAISTATTPNLIVTQGVLQMLPNNLIGLPVRLVRFQGEKMTGHNNLNWITAYESGHVVFELQRSADSRNFSTIFSTPARGIASGSSYSYHDYVPFIGKVFYRLRITEAGLPDNFSQTIMLEDGRRNFWTAYPNPVSSGGTLNLSVSNTGQPVTATIVLTDAAGRTVFTRQQAFVRGAQNISLFLNVPVGMYTLTITGFESNSSQKIIFQ